MSIYDKYQKPEAYSDDDFWKKLKKYAKKAGRELALLGLELWYVIKDPETPPWAKTAAMGALVYFVCPFDVIPDFIPVIGLTDDYGVMAYAYLKLASLITPVIKEAATKRLDEWFE